MDMNSSSRMRKMSLPARRHAMDDYSHLAGRRSSVGSRLAPFNNREQLAPIPAEELTSEEDDYNEAVTNVVLKIRNMRNELNIIRFDFIEGSDTVDGVVLELAEAGLIQRQDYIVICDNLRKILQDKPNCKHRVFSLFSRTERACDKKLIGYAKLSL